VCSCVRLKYERLIHQMKPLFSIVTLSLLASSSLVNAKFNINDMLLERDTEKSLQMAQFRLRQLKLKKDLASDIKIKESFTLERLELKKLVDLKFGNNSYKECKKVELEIAKDLHRMVRENTNPNIICYRFMYTLKTKCVTEHTFYTKLTTAVLNPYLDAVKKRKALEVKFDPDKASVSQLERKWLYHLQVESWFKSEDKPFTHYLPHVSFTDKKIELIRSLYKASLEGKKKLKDRLAALPPTQAIPDEKPVQKVSVKQLVPPTRGPSELDLKYAKEQEKKADPNYETKFGQKLEADLEEQKIVTAIEQAKNEAQTKFNNWIDLLEFRKQGRFSSEEQEQLRAMLEKFIPFFEEEQRVSGGSDHHFIKKCENKDFSYVMKALKKLTENSAINLRIQQRKEQESKEEKTSKPVKIYAYDDDKYVLFPNPDKNYTDFFNKSPQEALLPKLLELLNIHDDSAAFKASSKETKEARNQLIQLKSKKSGFVILPTGKTNPFLSAVVKAQRNGKGVYLYFNSKLLKQTQREELFKVFRDDHTLILLSSENLIFAIPHYGIEREILSLSTKQKLSTPQYQELFRLADDLWKETLPQTTLVSGEKTPSVSNPVQQKPVTPRNEQVKTTPATPCKVTIKPSDAQTKAHVTPIPIDTLAKEKEAKAAADKLAVKAAADKLAAKVAADKLAADKLAAKAAADKLAAKAATEKQAANPAANKPAVNIAPDKVAADKLAAKAAADKLAADKLAAKAAADKLAAKVAADKLAAKVAADKLAADKLAAKIAADKLAAKIAADKLAAKAAADKLAAKAAADKLAANPVANKPAVNVAPDKVAADKLAAKVAADKLAAKAAADKLAAKVAADKLAAKAAADKLAAKVAADKLAVNVAAQKQAVIEAAAKLAAAKQKSIPAASQNEKKPAAPAAAKPNPAPPPAAQVKKNPVAPVKANPIPIPSAKDPTKIAPVMKAAPPKDIKVQAINQKKAAAVK